jgi:hypothetical protein
MRMPVDSKSFFSFRGFSHSSVQPSRLCRHPSIRTLV